MWLEADHQGIFARACTGHQCNIHNTPLSVCTKQSCRSVNTGCDKLGLLKAAALDMINVLACAGGLNDAIFGVIIALTFAVAIFARYSLQLQSKLAIHNCHSADSCNCRKQDVLQYCDTTKSYIPQLISRLPSGTHNIQSHSQCMPSCMCTGS